MVNQNVTLLRAAPMGEIGVAFTNTQLRSDAPYLPINYQYNTKEQSRLGTYLQDGASVNAHGFGKGRLTYAGFSRPNNDFSVNQGWKRSDVHVPDKSVETTDANQPNYSERAANAKVWNARLTGRNFLPLPGPYQLPAGAQPRGGLVPIATTIDSTDPTSTAFSGEPYGILSSTNPTGVWTPYGPPAEGRVFHGKATLNPVRPGVRMGRRQR